MEQNFLYLRTQAMQVEIERLKGVNLKLTKDNSMLLKKIKRKDEIIKEQTDFIINEC